MRDCTKGKLVVCPRTHLLLMLVCHSVSSDNLHNVILQICHFLFCRSILSEIAALKSVLQISTRVTDCLRDNYVVRDIMEFRRFLKPSSSRQEHAVAQLIGALHYKPEGSGFGYRWRHSNQAIVKSWTTLCMSSDWKF